MEIKAFDMYHYNIGAKRSRIYYTAGKPADGNIKSKVDAAVFTCDFF